MTNDNEIVRAQFDGEELLTATTNTGEPYIYFRRTREGFDIQIADGVNLTEAAQRFIRQMKEIMYGSTEKKESRGWIALSEKLPPTGLWCVWWDVYSTREPTVGFLASGEAEEWTEGYTHWKELESIPDFSL